MKIKSKLILSFLAIALFIWIVSLSSIHVSRIELEKTIGDNSVLLASETLDKIDREIYHGIQLWEFYSKDILLQQTVKNSNNEFDAMGNAQQYIDKQDRDWRKESSETITSFMQELIGTEISQELRQGERGHFVEVLITNKYGANVAQNQKTTDYYQADEIWWQQAKEKGKYIEDVKYDESARAYSISFAIRIEDESGNFLGIIKAVYDIEEIVKIIKELENLERHESTHVKLISTDGKVIYAPEEYYDFEALEVISEDLLTMIHREKGNEYFISSELEPEEGEILFAHAHSNGFRDYEGLGWILMLEEETEELFWPITRLRNFILLVSLILTILAGVAGFFIARSIAKPISRLEKEMNEMKKGKEFKEVPLKGDTESKSLTDSFNQLTKSLAKKSHDLERFTKIAIGREEKMIELKKKLREKEKSGKK